MPVKGETRVHVEAGARYGRLTVLERTNGHQSLAPVRCECGTEKGVKVTNLLNGSTKSCGCARTRNRAEAFKRRWERAFADPASDPTIKHVIAVGDTFGDWTVVGGRHPGGGNRLRVRCACGTEREMRPQALYEGRSRSCGCGYVRERAEKQARSQQMADEARRRETPITWRTVLPGTKAGSLTILRRSDLPEHVEVRCERCGRQYETPLRLLTSMGVKACGCRQGKHAWEVEHGWDGQYGMPAFYTEAPDLFPVGSLRLSRYGRLRQVVRVDPLADSDRVHVVYTVPVDEAG